MRATAALLLAGVLALAGCSEQEAQDAVDQVREQASAVDEVQEQVSAIEGIELPEVDWGQYGEQFQRRVDRLVEQADCESLERELARVEPNDTELTRYLKAQIRRVC